MRTRITELFQIKYPVVQAGMIWCSGWELASAVSNAGGLGLIGSGSMYPDILREQIRKCKAATDKPFGVNVPLFYPDIDKHMAIIAEEEVKIVFTSAGNPLTWTKWLQEKGITVVQVISNLKFAKKSEDAGVDALVAEGFEAGGHNGREETTTMCLIPMIRDAVQLPLIAAGGIGDGRAMAAAFCLGAEGVQVGSRFAATLESSAHQNFKNAIVDAGDGATELTLKELTPVRLIKNHFYQEVQDAYKHHADRDALSELLGHGRSKKGMFLGDLEEGELEIGQVSALIHDIKPAAEILHEIVDGFEKTMQKLRQM